MRTIFDCPADVEVTFRFNGTRCTPAADGYRPAHRIREDYLTIPEEHLKDVQVAMTISGGEIVYENKE